MILTQYVIAATEKEALSQIANECPVRVYLGTNAATAKQMFLQHGCDMAVPPLEIFAVHTITEVIKR